ncbi:MAG: hypothetical protein JXA22_00735 [Candidatus Thermoplasmatota archaeon]|nr:hypothetical protein [Candidatus Thermoplasmatota archaeon]
MRKREKVDIMESIEALCPRCGRKNLVKKWLKNGKYTIVCRTCGLKRGEFIPDNKNGIV